MREPGRRASARATIEGKERGLSEDSIEQQALRRRFEEIYEANHTALAAYALRRASNAEDASEVVAETFTVAWRRIRQVPRGREATLWLFGTARRVLANQRRGQRRRLRLSLRLQAMPAEALSAPADRAGEIEVARLAMRRLPAAQRDLLGLVAWEGISTAELAVVLGCSENAAKIRLHRARKALLSELERLNADGEAKPAAALGHGLDAMQGASPIPGETR
jgi:RNA polymerase sigma-70 factor (ECF subfamily)